MKKPKPSIIYMPPRSAEYLCLRCEHRFSGWAGPVQCPKCGYFYVKWLDYRP